MASANSKNGVEHGVFTKDGQEVIAYSVDDAVRLRFDGWQEKVPPAKENQPQPAE